MIFAQTPTIERDSNITRMRLDVFAAMEEIANRELPPIPLQSSPEIRFVSFEEAVRELLAVAK